MTTLFEDETQDTRNGQSEQATVLDAPDYAKLIGKGDLNSIGKEYETKVASAFKTLTLGALRNEMVYDGATFLHYGDAFANATGHLVQESPGAKKTVDFLTAPDNAWVLWAAVALPMTLQLIRNHEPEIKDARKTRKQKKAEKKRAIEAGTYVAPQKHPVTIRLPFGRRITLNMRIHIPVVSNALKFFSAQTTEPDELAKKVFTDKKVIDALAKHKIKVQFTDVPS